MIEFQHELDTRKEHCPGPVIQTKQTLLRMMPGEVLHVMSTDPASVEDIDILLGTLHDEMIESSEQQGEYHFYIRKK